MKRRNFLIRAALGGAMTFLHLKRERPDYDFRSPFKYYGYDFEIRYFLEDERLALYRECEINGELYHIALWSDIDSWTPEKQNSRCHLILKKEHNERTMLMLEGLKRSENEWRKYCKSNIGGALTHQRVWLREYCKSNPELAGFFKGC